MAVTNVDKTTLNNATDAAEKAASSAGDATKAAASIEEKIAAAKEVASTNPVSDAIDSAQSKVSELTSNITKNLPDGIKKIGANVLGLDGDNVFSQTVGELKTTVKHAENAVSFLTGKKSFGSLSGFTRGGENPQDILDGAAKGKLRTFVMPEDFNPDLCFRMDFLKFSRQSVFEAQKAEPVSTFVFPLPKNIATSQGTNYTDSELGNVGDIEARLRGNNFSGDIGELASKITGEVAGSVGTAVFRQALATEVGQAGSLAVGFVPNPHLANIFKGVPFREFTFDVSIAPRNARESDTLQNVLDHFRSYMLPAMSTKMTTLDYPHELAISFSASGSSLIAGGNGKTPLDRIFNFKRCVCTNVGITVNGQPGTQVFFADKAPAEVTISFSFKEVAISVANDYGHKTAGVQADKLGDKLMSKFDSAAQGASNAIESERQRQGGGE